MLLKKWRVAALTVVALVGIAMTGCTHQNIVTTGENVTTIALRPFKAPTTGFVRVGDTLKCAPNLTPVTIKAHKGKTWHDHYVVYTGSEMPDFKTKKIVNGIGWVIMYDDFPAKVAIIELAHVTTDPQGIRYYHPAGEAALVWPHKPGGLGVNLYPADFKADSITSITLCANPQ